MEPDGSLFCCEHQKTKIVTTLNWDNITERWLTDNDFQSFHSYICRSTTKCASFSHWAI